ncbi:hypothetical protein R1sor_015939 [Riccia sorocarpa]|uniref:RING-type domain-containing protein n=1 Tax=Riccia sorocarpa TaxID=122646 RepID=A0ABD3HHN7_9MARC
MQEIIDIENEEMDLRRPRALVNSVEKWRRSNGVPSSSGTGRRQLKSVERTSLSMSGISDGVWNGPLEQPGEDVGVVGSVKIEQPAGRRVTRAGSRNLQANLVEQKSVGEGLGGGNSQAAQDLIDKSTELQLGLGPSSSVGIVQGQGRKDPSGKEIRGTSDDEEDFVMVPDSQRCDDDGRNGIADAERSRSRRTRLGKQIQIDGSDDDSSHPETLLCLGTHPRVGSAPGNSGRGSSSRSPRLGDPEPGNLHGSEGTTSRGKRKRSIDRSESAAAVGMALENAGREFDNPSQSGGRHFPERPHGRHFMQALPTWRDQQRAAEPELECRFFPISEPLSRTRPFRMNSRSGVRSDSQPIVLDPEETHGRAEVDLTEEVNYQPLTLSLQSPPSTGNLAGQLSSGFHPQIIDLLSPEAGHANANGVIDLVSPERSPSRSGVLGSPVAREEPFARRGRSRRERMRIRFQNSINDGLRASTARQRRAADGAGSSQYTLDPVELADNEHDESIRYGGRSYIVAGGYSNPFFDPQDALIVGELPIYNHMPGGSHRRRQRPAFPRGYTSSSGGQPAMRGSFQGLSGDFLAGMSDEEPFCYTDNVVSVGDLNDDENERSRQVADDERIARQLQATYASEAVGGEVPDDETLARMLQAEEDSRARDIRHTRAGELFGLSAAQRFIGDLESLRRESPPRFLRHVRPRSDTSAYSSSSSRFNFGPGTRSGRFFPMHRGQQDIDSDSHAGRVHFPSHMTMESRLEVLAALESVIQDNIPVGLQLAQVDRDFNENDYEMLLALDADLDRNKGASIEKINLLPVTTLQPTDVCEDTCSICLEMQVAGEVVRRLPCIHVFHMKCIDKWLQRQAVCPVCKAHI